MNRSALLGIAGVGVVGVALALFMVWRGSTTTTVPAIPEAPEAGTEQTAASAPSADEVPPETPSSPPSPIAGHTRPVQRPPQTPTDARFASSNAQFNDLAHHPLFEEVRPDLSLDETRERISEILDEVTEFEAQMQQMADSSSPEVGREARQRGAIVLERAAEQLPMRPPEGLSDTEQGQWEQAIEEQRNNLIERSRTLLGSGSND